MDRSKQLGEEKVLNLLVKFSIPAIIGMLVNALYNIVDRIFIGNGVGSNGIAGAAIGFPIMLIMMACAMLIGIGANSLVSIRLGEQKKEEAELIMGNALVLLVVLPAIIAFFGLMFLDPLLRSFGASEAVLPYAREYMRIILFGAIFQSVGMGMNNFIRSEGNPKIAMVTMLIGAILNTILDPLFIFVFNWGIAGAAYATILSQAVSAIWVLYHFLYGKGILKLQVKNFKLKIAVIGKIVAIGAAPFLMQFAASILNAIMNRSLSVYGGDVAVSGMSAVMSITMLFLMPIFGINQGVQPIIGYNYGAHKYDRVKEALKLGIFAATALVIFGFIITRLYSTQLISIFNAKDPELIAFGAHALKVFLIFMPIIGFQIVSANYFQAVGKPLQAGLLSLSRQVLILIPAMLILPGYFGLEGVLYAGPLADIVSSVITGLFLFYELRHLDNKHQSMQIKEA
ncbi:MAG TPA: MATE family efflux transporter [Patescibacteria group bacterium]|nr:MATE family efflux transporter [Patescibacteria group bacterium]